MAVPPASRHRPYPSEREGRLLSGDHRWRSHVRPVFVPLIALTLTNGEVIEARLGEGPAALGLLGIAMVVETAVLLVKKRTPFLRVAGR